MLAEAEYTKSSTWQRSVEIARARGADPRRVFAERPPEHGELLAIRGMQQALRIELDLADAQARARTEPPRGVHLIRLLSTYDALWPLTIYTSAVKYFVYEDLQNTDSFNL